jgi:hypothetical protein
MAKTQLPKYVSCDLLLFSMLCVETILPMYTCIGLYPVICKVTSFVAHASPPSRFILPCYVQGVTNALVHVPSLISISKTPTYDPQVREFLDIKA